MQALAPTLLRALRAECTKLVSLRLALHTALATIVLAVAASWVLTRLIDAAYRAGQPEETAGLETGSAFLVILHYGQIGVVLLAAWVVHQEAEPGSLRSTLLSVPQRGVVLAAKAIAVTAAAALVGAAAAFGSAGVRCLVVDCAAPASRFAPTTSAELMVLLGVTAYWVLIALFTFSLAMLLRSGLIAMGIVLALVLAVSMHLLNVTPLARYLPDQAGAQLYQPPPILDGDLGPSVGGLILLAWTLSALTVAAIAFHHQPVRH